MSKDEPYKFKSWVTHHGYAQGSGDWVDISKQQVWSAVKNDPDFRKLRLFKIRVEDMRPTGAYYANFNSTPITQKTYITGWHYCKNLAEARKLGQVIEEVTTAVKKYPKAKNSPRKNARRQS